MHTGITFPTRAWELGAKEIRETRWRELLDRGLRRLGPTSGNLRQDRKSAPWNVALAAWLKQET